MATMDARTTRIALAAGMVSAQVNCSLDESLLRMQEHARRVHHTLDEIALAIVERRVNFWDAQPARP